jgi:hypothetical protein
MRKYTYNMGRRMRAKTNRRRTMKRRSTRRSRRRSRRGSTKRRSRRGSRALKQLGASRRAHARDPDKQAAMNIRLERHKRILAKITGKYPDEDYGTRLSMVKDYARIKKTQSEHPSSQIATLTDDDTIQLVKLTRAVKADADAERESEPRLDKECTLADIKMAVNVLEMRKTYRGKTDAELVKVAKINRQKAAAADELAEKHDEAAAEYNQGAAPPEPVSSSKASTSGGSGGNVSITSTGQRDRRNLKIPRRARMEAQHGVPGVWGK